MSCKALTTKPNHPQCTRTARIEGFCRQHYNLKTVKNKIIKLDCDPIVEEIEINIPGWSCLEFKTVSDMVIHFSEIIKNQKNEISTYKTMEAKNIETFIELRKDNFNLKELNRKIIEQNLSFKKEMAVLHTRVKSYVKSSKEYEESIKLIQDMDRIKYELMQLGEASTPFKALIRKFKYKDKLEKIFGCEFGKIPDKYREMLYTRNDLCHKFTKKTWDVGTFSTHSKYLTQSKILQR